MGNEDENYAPFYITFPYTERKKSMIRALAADTNACGRDGPEGFPVEAPCDVMLG